jgi:tRNA-dihydrouridine synthase
VNEDALREIKYSIKVPLIANGDVKSFSAAKLLQEKTDCDGGCNICKNINTNY